MHPGLVVRKYRQEKDLSQRDLARTLGYQGRGNLGNWETGQEEVPPERYPDLIRAIDIPPDEILACTPGDKRNAAEAHLMRANIPFTQHVQLETLVAEGSLGKISIHDGGRTKDFVRVEKRPGHLVPVVGTVSGDPDTAFVWEELTTEDPLDYSGCRAVRVQGDSMEPVALPGQYAVYRPDDDVRDGNLAIIRLVSGETLFKRVFYEEKGDSLICESVRAGNRPRVIDLDKIEWVHKVIGVRF